MDVVFLLQDGGVESYGELQQAVSFASQIRAAGYRPWFLSGERSAGRVRRAGQQVVVFDSPQLARAIIEALDPALLIACELFGLPPELLALLEDLDRPLATIDGTTLGEAIAGDPFESPRFRRELKLPAEYLTLRPCPVHDIGPDGEGVFHWPLFPDAVRVSKDAARYAELGLDPSRRTVLLPIAPWAEHFAGLEEEPFRAFRDYHERLVETLLAGLETCGEEVELVVVAQRRPAPREGRVALRAPGLLPYDAFTHVLASCDLLVSDNIIQASIAKAVVAGTPHLVLLNLAPSGLPYPCNIVPLRRLFPLERAFARLVEVVELSESDEVAKTLRALLARGSRDRRRRARREAYLGRLGELAAPGEILAQCIGPPRPLPPEARPAGPPRDVVFYLEIWFSFGEREHALALARRFREAGYRPRFVVEHRVADHIRAAGFEPVPFYSPAMGLRAVRRIDPLLVVGCELFNLSEESARGLIALGKPLASVDGTSLGVEINADPFFHPRLTRELVLPERFLAFRPCPVNDPVSGDPEVVCYDPFRGATRLPKDTAFYAELGLDPARRTVMLPIALWAVSGAMLFRLDSYHGLLVERVAAGLRNCAQAVDLVVIGLREPGVSEEGSLRIVRVEGLPYPRYDALLRSCDAIVADNIIQTSVSKALALGIPHLVVQNLQPSEVPFPCNIFPLKLLFPPERSYARAVEVAEFGDPEDIRTKLAALLERGYADPTRRERRAAYLAQVAALGDPAAALARFLAEAKAAGT